MYGARAGYERCAFADDHPPAARLEQAARAGALSAAL